MSRRPIRGARTKKTEVAVTPNIVMLVVTLIVGVMAVIIGGLTIILLTQIAFKQYKDTANQDNEVGTNGKKGWLAAWATRYAERHAEK